MADVPVSLPGQKYTPPHGWRIRKNFKSYVNDPFIAKALGADVESRSNILFWCREDSQWYRTGYYATCYGTREEAESEAFFLASQNIDSMIDVVEW